VHNASHEKEGEGVCECIHSDCKWTNDEGGHNHTPPAETVSENATDGIKGKVGERVCGDGNTYDEGGPAKLLRTRPDDREQGEVVNKRQENGKVDRRFCLFTQFTLDQVR
jgi:hypothetical protein